MIPGSTPRTGPSWTCGPATEAPTSSGSSPEIFRGSGRGWAGQGRGLGSAGAAGISPQNVHAPGPFEAVLDYRGLLPSQIGGVTVHDIFRLPPGSRPAPARLPPGPA